MNPYNYPYMQQTPVMPQHIEPKIMTYTVDSVEQLATLPPALNTIYIGMSRDGSKIFQRRMNNDGLMEVKTYSLVVEQTKKTDMQEILGRLSNIEKKLGVIDERNVIDVTE
jgi:hypothetical protein